MAQNIINQVHLSLLKKKKTLGVAESCTGGLVSKFLTDLSGSSGYFLLGVVAYSNLAKSKILKIPAALTQPLRAGAGQKGAVSAAVAQKMAAHVRKLAKADFGIGVTGIAGPAGGTAQKPVGTVFIAVADSRKTICRKFLFRGNRSQIRNQAAMKSLELLKELL